MLFAVRRVAWTSSSSLPRLWQPRSKTKCVTNHVKRDQTGCFVMGGGVFSSPSLEAIRSKGSALGAGNAYDGVL